MTALVVGLAAAALSCSIFALIQAQRATARSGSSTGGFQRTARCWNSAAHVNRADPRCFAGGCTECCSRFCRGAHGTSCGESVNAAAMGAARVAESIKRLRAIGWLLDEGEHWRLSKQATAHAAGVAVIYALSSEAEKQNT